MRGAFITLEGGEGVGKSTSLETIRQVLIALGHEVLLTREPGGTDLGERIREWMLEGEHAKPSPVVEALLMFAARGQHLQTVIEPALSRGVWVVSDRFSDATFAYQGGGRGVPDPLLNCLVDAVQGDLRPDLTLLLDAPIEVGFSRISHRERDNFEREAHTFFERVRARYLALAKAAPERIHTVDAAHAPEVVNAHIERVLRTFDQDWRHG